MRDTAPVLEVFASYQGEGLFVGQGQTFLRLAGCPLRCRYCDTPHSWARPAEVAEGDEGEHSSPFEALVQVRGVEWPGYRPISVTGGEPLVWEGFLRGLRAVAGERALHLETAAPDPEALARVAPGFEHLSIDLKLPTDLAPPAAAEWPEHTWPADAADWDHVRARVLAIVAERTQRGRRDALKLVVTPGTDPAAFEPLLDDVARLAPHTALFLAPASPRRELDFPDLSAFDAVFTLALEAGLDPRALPQMHRVLGIR